MGFRRSSHPQPHAKNPQISWGSTWPIRLERMVGWWSLERVTGFEPTTPTWAKPNHVATSVRYKRVHAPGPHCFSDDIVIIWACLGVWRDAAFLKGGDPGRSGVGDAEKRGRQPVRWRHAAWVGQEGFSFGDRETERSRTDEPWLCSPCLSVAIYFPPCAASARWCTECGCRRVSRCLDVAGAVRAVRACWMGGGRRPACHRRIISSRRPKMRARHARIRAWIAAGSQACAGVARVATRRLATVSAREEGCEGMGAFSGGMFSGR